MKYLIYGDDLEKVIRESDLLLAKYKQAVIVRFDAEKDSYDDWLKVVNVGLFDGLSKRVYKIQNLFTGRKSKGKEKIKKFIKDYSGKDVFLVVEKKMLRKAAGYFDKVFKFKKQVYLFDFLDVIGKKEFNKIPAFMKKISEPYELFLFMVLKRIEELVIWVNSKKQPQNFYERKLKYQAQKWSLKELFNFEKSLLNFDLGYKMGLRHYHNDPKLALSLYLFTYNKEDKNV